MLQGIFALWVIADLERDAAYQRKPSCSRDFGIEDVAEFLLVN